MADFALTCFLPFRLNRLAAEISEQLATLYAERFDIDIPQWRVLATLSAGETWTAKAIVASTRTHKSTISRAVEALSRRGLIESIRAPDDKRAFHLRLTAAGRKLFRQLEPLVLDYERDLLARLSESEGRALARGIGALEKALKLEERRDEAL
ncbi:MarR family winged helix-turn-helix transcriptional regulator [Aestuariivirga sp. YIM B02566]|uniref:MarR family transcriptional regulator n=1 Tax=Taklimakanibacter albus TaxID=2800327 RepID=A0ACC5REY0_9HYPH|nr:MarR family transcriptional regulator [Aestuariivirga sp. YIM B02566]MBK1871194.1 MarR family transcriptional regulator [Aestuariivirga sp. YIM B02566]